MQASINTLSIQETLDKKARRQEVISSMLPFAGLTFISVFLIVVTKGRILNPSNLVNLINQCFTVSLVGVGAAFVYAHGGMDFSIGASSGLAQFVSILILTRTGFPVWVAILVSILIGVICSTLVGSASILLRVPVFITSLSVRSICAGILALGTNGMELRLDYARYAGFNNALLKLSVLIAMIAIGYYLFEKTALGRKEKAMGGNIRTAFQAGVKVDKSRILTYSIMGFCVGLAAFFQLTRAGIVTASSGSGLEFDIMMAIVLGGFPMMGGSAAKFRAVIIGAMIITILSNGLIIWGVDFTIINGLKGLLLIAIVAISYDRTNQKQMTMV